MDDAQNNATATLVRAPAGRVAGFAVRAVSGPSTGTVFHSRAGVACRIGSSSEVELRLDDRAVSRTHCELVGGAAGVMLRDLGSKNGVTLDGVAVIEAAVRHGSVIRLGQTELRVELAGLIDRVPPSARDTFGKLRGSSRAMREVFALLERLASSDTTVLLRGETGTGKENAAHALHAESPRRDRPFVVVDCAAISPTMIESELFGHVVGSFTGADRDRAGAFVTAAGGTIFLDEIGELPIDLQPRLLRAVESRTIRPIGSSVEHPIDVRIVAATNRDLAQEVTAGRFRRDLYFRIAVFEVEMPPLRERPEDLPPLIELFLDRLGLAPEDPLRRDLLGAAALAVLQASAWPGNVRELRNHVELCVAQRRVAPVFGAMKDVPHSDEDFRAGLQRVIGHYEQAYLARMLEACGGNVSEAIRRSGIGRATMYQLLNRHPHLRR
jgi:DNA-binding NtrC family response regulator